MKLADTLNNPKMITFDEMKMFIKYNIEFNINQINIINSYSHIYWIIDNCPQFTDKCDWSSLTGRDWSRLLSTHPQVADKCDWYKLTEYEWNLLISKYKK